MRLICISIIIFMLSSIFIYSKLNENPPGYCKVQERYIADDEFINAAVLITARHAKLFDQNIRSSSFFANWNGYIPSMNDPSCCIVDRKKTYSFYNRIFSVQVIRVLVSPTIRNKTGVWANVINFKFDVCGVLMDSDLNVKSTESKLITTETLLKRK